MVRTVLSSAVAMCPAPPLSAERGPHPHHSAHSEASRVALPISYPVGSTTLQLSGVQIQVLLPSALQCRAETRDETTDELRQRLQQLVRVTLEVSVRGATDDASATRSGTKRSRAGDRAFVLGSVCLPIPSPTAAASYAAVPLHPAADSSAALRRSSSSDGRFNPFALSRGRPNTAAAEKERDESPNEPSKKTRNTKLQKLPTANHTSVAEAAIPEMDSASSITAVLPPFLLSSAHFMPLDLRVQMERLRVDAVVEVIPLAKCAPWVRRALRSLPAASRGGEEAEVARRKAKREAHEAQERAFAPPPGHPQTPKGSVMMDRASEGSGTGKRAQGVHSAVEWPDRLEVHVTVMGTVTSLVAGA